MFEFSIEGQSDQNGRYSIWECRDKSWHLGKKELCVELVDRLDVAEDGGEGVRVQAQGLVVPVDSAVEDLGG